MKELSQMVAADVMVSPIVCVRVDEKLRDVEKDLVRANVGGAPVLKDGRMVGIVSRSDFVRVPVLLESLDGYVSEQLANYPPSEAARVKHFREGFTELKTGDVMTTQVISCLLDKPVAEIASSMVKHHVHRVVVLENDVPVGIVESLDLVRLLTS